MSKPGSLSPIQKEAGAHQGGKSLSTEILHHEDQARVRAGLQCSAVVSEGQIIVAVGVTQDRLQQLEPMLQAWRIL